MIKSLHSNSSLLELSYAIIASDDRVDWNNFEEFYMALQSEGVNLGEIPNILKFFRIYIVAWTSNFSESYEYMRRLCIIARVSGRADLRDIMIAECWECHDLMMELY